ncbi:immune inhibitor A domain-containing protein [Pseudalkalibacillus sp. SCS-8]|uniref:immune inhibitor A domain-containing protein n=1 Tax=Pseudalkalibacillus nanhaiensis TaxID=3115291 RepID=UPI0032DBE4D8
MKIWKTIVCLSTLSVGLVFGASPQESSAKTIFSDDPLNPDFDIPGPIDLGVVNDEKLIEALVERGEISNSLSVSGKEAALKRYLERKTDGLDDAYLHHYTLEEEQKNKIQDTRAFLQKGMNVKEQKHFHERIERLELPPIQSEEWNGGVRKDRVLVIAIDFPDYPTGSITPEETDMYYDEYPVEHYEDMIFGDEGYEGPNGETFISMKQYYEQQSGGSYSVQGEVAGWYTAEHPAAYYGANVPNPDGRDGRPRYLVAEALSKAAQDPSINLADYDQEDRYDLDNDGNYREPDGLIDHLMIIHSGVGEEAGGGSLGSDAIWSHRWNLGGVFLIPGTYTNVPYWNGFLGAYDYTIEPEDGATGVFAHEYGHDLALPDEYDTQYTGQGEPVAYWSIMSSGSWAGKIPGTEPTGFSVWAKEFLQGYIGGNWLTGVSIDTEDPTFVGQLIFLDQASEKGRWNDAIRIELPDKVTIVNQPYNGRYEYHSGKGNLLNHSMVTSLDLTTAEQAQLTFQAWYEIEKDWDYASIQVREFGTDEWVSIPGNLTTTENPNDQNPGHGITGHSDGWVEGYFNLTQYAGKQIELRIHYWTDMAVAEKGLYIDDIRIYVNDKPFLHDNAESVPKFRMHGFKKDKGKFSSKQYYLLEWRNHHGVDMGLKHILRGNSLMEYDPGLVVWYIDESYTDNWTGDHPGEGFVGVVDAHQHTLEWSDGSIASTKYQINDAAFGIVNTNEEFLDYGDTLGISLTSPELRGDRSFYDGDDFLNSGLLDAGRNIPDFGLHFVVIAHTKDKSTALIGIYKEQ